MGFKNQKFEILGIVVFFAMVAILFLFWNNNNSQQQELNNTTEQTEQTEQQGVVEEEQSNDSVRFNTWDAETASSIYFDSYELMEEYFRTEEEKVLTEYNKAIKGTIVERVQDAFVPSYDNNKDQLAQLQNGEILIKEPASEEFPEGISLWAAKLEKDKNSFVIGDFNKDGLSDVAHIIAYTGFGSGYFYHLMIFVNDHGKLKYLTDEYLGDRVVIKDVRYESGLFAIDMITQGEGGDFTGQCCPNVPTTIKFRLENGQLDNINN